MKHRLLTLIPALVFVLSLGLAALPATSISAQTPAPTVSPVTTTLTGINRAFALRVRESPSLRATRLFFLKRNQMVTILGISDNHRWFKIKTQDGKVGWVYRFFIRLVGGHIANLATLQ